MKSLPHDSAHNHVTGKSQYVDDRVAMKNELHCQVIFSKIAHSKIEKIDFTKALNCPGVLAGFTGDDFAHNLWGTIFKDQPVLASDISQYAGEPIALLVGEDPLELSYAKNQVEVIETELESIRTIKDAINQQSFIGDARTIESGDFQKAFDESPHQHRGEITIAGADHFYLESQGCVVYPGEDGQLEVHSSSQHPTETQHVVAHCLGVPDKDVVCIVKRMGGGFGGKESQAAPFAAMAALVAQKFNRPCRLMLTKDDDMIMTGKRNPFFNRYQVGFDQEGKINALKVDLHSDAGAYADLSTAIMERAMLHCDNSYWIPNMSIRGQVCKTHHHPHTAFRGFGGPKGVATIEKIIEEVATLVRKDALEIRKINCYGNAGNGVQTHYGQEFKNNCLPRLFDDLEKNSQYQQRREEIKKYNSEQNQFVRGLSMTSVKFGISFTTRFLNQGNALVIVHQDGSIQISTGATEMGQGVNSRISQMVTEELGLPRDMARVMPTRTDKNANTSPTAASTGTDINGSAAVIATRKIKQRLSALAIELFKKDRSRWASQTAGLGSEPEIQVSEERIHPYLPNEGTTWETGTREFHGVIFKDQVVTHADFPGVEIAFSDLVVEAYLNRISLSDYAFYKIPGIEFNKLTGKGDAFLYYSQGAALSEVEVNRLTGEMKVRSSEILMDLGRPINYELDRGQVAGAFIQGMGWLTTEKLVYNEKGLLTTHAPSTYKIPNIQDTPRNFSVELFRNEENYQNVRGTKAVGEPPLLLSISVWCAMMDALRNAGCKEIELPIPATAETLLSRLTPDLFEEYS